VRPVVASGPLQQFDVRGLHLFAGLLWALLGLNVHAQQTVVLYAVADNSIYSNSVDRADGAGPHLWVGQHAGGVNQRALVRFDLSSLAPGTVVTRARLVLTMSKTISPGKVIGVHRLGASWGEGTSNNGSGGGGTQASANDSTWGFRFYGPRLAWASPGADFAASSSADLLVTTAGGPNTWVSPGLATDAQSWIDNPTANHGWILIGEENDRSAMRFESRQVGFQEIAPRLELDVQAAPVALPSPFQAPELSVYMSGASAPQNLLGALANSLFRTDLDPVLGQFQINVYFDNNNTPVDQTDDGTGYRAYYGVMRSSADIPAALRGKRVLLLNRAKGGSAWGVNPVARAQAIQTMPINSANCSTAPNGVFRCGLAGVDPGLGAPTGAEAVPDFGVSDLPPAMFKGPANVEFGLTQLTEVETGRLTVRASNTLMMGMVATTNVPDTTFFSRALYGAILAGGLQQWSQVNPAIATGNTQIVICRRVQGSGTQASYNWYFNNFPCQFGGIAGTGSQSPARMTNSATFQIDGEWPLLNPADPATGGMVANPRLIRPADGFTVVENPTSGDVRTCLARAVAGGDHNFTGDDGLAYRVQFGGGGYRAVGTLSLDSLNTMPPTTGFDSSEQSGRWSFRNMDGAGSFRTTTFNSANPVFTETGTGISPSKANHLSGAYDFSAELSFQFRAVAVGTASALSADPLKTAFVDLFIQRASDPAILSTLPGGPRAATAALPDFNWPTASNVTRASRGGNMCSPLVYFR